MKRLLFILACLLPLLLGAQQMMYENRPAVGTGTSQGPSGLNLGYLTNGLVEWNKFNDSAGAVVAADASGNGNTVPLTGSPVLNGSYLTLNGTNQYGDAGTNQLTSLDYGNMTICAWINKTGSSQKGIVDKSFNIPGFGYGGWGFWVLAGNQLDWWLEQGQDLVDGGAQTMVPGQWTFVTVIWQPGLHEADFYINGVLNSKTQNGGALQGPSYPADLQIGNLHDNANGGAFAFDGSMHDVGIYNRALSAAEIKTNFLYTEWNTNVTFPDLLYYKMTEYAQTNPPVSLADSSTHGGTTGTVGDSTTVQWVTNVADLPETAVRFDGSTYINTSNSVLFNFTSNLFTLNLWVCPQTGNGSLAGNADYQADGWYLSLGGNGEVSFGTETQGADNAITTGPGWVPNGSYSMISVVRTAPNSAAIYVNGMEAGTTGGIASPLSSSNALIFGRNQPGNNYYYGDLWLPQIWGSALASSDIANLYFTQSLGYPFPVAASIINTNGGSTNCVNCGNTNTNCTTCGSTNSGGTNVTFYLTNGLVEWNKLNDPSGTTNAADASGYGNTLPLIGNPVLNGDYLTLDGTNQYGDAGTNQLASLDDQDKTICAWINKTGSSYKGIVDKSFDLSGIGYGGWGFWILGNNTLDWNVQPGQDLIDSGFQTIALGQWTFVTVVWHHSIDQADFYLNGVLNSSANNGAAQERPSQYADLQVGNLQNNLGGGTYAFDGSMHDIGIYNRALSAAEVESNYLTSEPTTNVIFPDLLYYKMTEYPASNPPVYLADSSTHGGTTGTVLLSYPDELQWETNGAFIPNTAVHFNGVATHIDTSNSVLFNFTTNFFTINMWVCPLTANGYLMENGIYLTNGWSLRVGGQYQLYFCTETNGTESVVGTGPGVANVNKYTMITIVRNSPTNVLIYMNGIQTTTTGNIGIPAPSTNSLWFGADRAGAHFYDGNIWLPQIWGEPLAPGDVANLYFQQSRGYPWP